MQATHQPLHQFWIEEGACPCLHSGQGLLLGNGFTPQTSVDQVEVGVHDPEHASQEGNPGARQQVRVA